MERAYWLAWYLKLWRNKSKDLSGIFPKETKYILEIIIIKFSCVQRFHRTVETYNFVPGNRDVWYKSKISLLPVKGLIFFV